MGQTTSDMPNNSSSIAEFASPLFLKMSNGFLSGNDKQLHNLMNERQLQPNMVFGALSSIFKRYITPVNHDIMIMKLHEFKKFLRDYHDPNSLSLDGNKLFSLLCGNFPVMTFRQFVLLSLLIDSGCPHNLSGPSGCMRLSILFHYYDEGKKGSWDSVDLQRLYEDIAFVQHPSFSKMELVAPPHVMEWHPNVRLTIFDVHMNAIKKNVRGTSRLLRILPTFISSPSLSSTSPIIQNSSKNDLNPNIHAKLVPAVPMQHQNVVSMLPPPPPFPCRAGMSSGRNPMEQQHSDAPFTSRVMNSASIKLGKPALEPLKFQDKITHSNLINMRDNNKDKSNDDNENDGGRSNPASPASGSYCFDDENVNSIRPETTAVNTADNVDGKLDDNMHHFNYIERFSGLIENYEKENKGFYCELQQMEESSVFVQNNRLSPGPRSKFSVTNLRNNNSQKDVCFYSSPSSCKGSELAPTIHFSPCNRLETATNCSRQLLEENIEFVAKKSSAARCLSNVSACSFSVDKTYKEDRNQLENCLQESDDDCDGINVPSVLIDNIKISQKINNALDSASYSSPLHIQNNIDTEGSFSNTINKNSSWKQTISNGDTQNFNNHIMMSRPSVSLTRRNNFNYTQQGGATNGATSISPKQMGNLRPLSKDGGLLCGISSIAQSEIRTNDNRGLLYCNDEERLDGFEFRVPSTQIHRRQKLKPEQRLDCEGFVFIN